MHDTMTRLYEAIQTTRGVSGQTPVARLMNVSPQLIRNWEQRGVSLEGMLDAQEIMSVNAVWIRKGDGPMLLGEGRASVDGLADSMKLTTETAKELLLLQVHRLSNQDNRRSIDIAVELARKELRWSGAINQPQ